jgi:high-affinity Fe2+/Pb2+ permease
MLASFLITFREALEAALIIGIIAAYVAKLGRKDLNRYINIGIMGALAASLAVAMVFKIWMANNSRQIKGEIQEKIDISISKGQILDNNWNIRLQELQNRDGDEKWKQIPPELKNT